MNNELAIALATSGGVIAGALLTGIADWFRRKNQIEWDFWQDHNAIYADFLAKAGAWQYEMIWAARSAQNENELKNIALQPRVMDAHANLLPAASRLRLIASEPVREAAETITASIWARKGLLIRDDAEAYTSATENWVEAREAYLKAVKNDIPREKFKVFQGVDARMMSYQQREGSNSVSWHGDPPQPTPMHYQTQQIPTQDFPNKISPKNKNKLISRTAKESQR